MVSGTISATGVGSIEGYSLLKVSPSSAIKSIKHSTNTRKLPLESGGFLLGSAG